jgi:hypothetical protein
MRDSKGTEGLQRGRGLKGDGSHLLGRKTTPVPLSAGPLCSPYRRPVFPPRQTSEESAKEEFSWHSRLAEEPSADARKLLASGDIEDERAAQRGVNQDTARLLFLDPADRHGL